MAVTKETNDDLMLRSQEIVRSLANDEALKPHVDAELPLPRPFCGSGEIHLVIIGQDPTVANGDARRKIKTALMLDSKGNLQRFLASVCERLGYTLENVYATNLCKNFFKETPSQVKRKYEIDVIGLSSPQWLPLLKEELSWFPNAAVLTLGEPVLRSLLRPSHSRCLRDYWGYGHDCSENALSTMKAVLAERNLVDRMFFPFVHVNSIRRGWFYTARVDDYLAFIRNEIRQEGHGSQS